MAKDLESERRKIEAKEAKLKAQRERLSEMENSEVRKHLSKSRPSNLSLEQIDALSSAIETHGIAEALKRLS